MIDKIVSLITEKLPEYKGKEDEVRGIVLKHMSFGTIEAIFRNGECIAVTRWNISPTGTTANVLDLVVADGVDGVRIIKKLILRGWLRFPTLKYICFERGLKYSGQKTLSIQKILRKEL